MDIKMSELIEAFSARSSYARKKLELNAGKKYEQKWIDVCNHARNVLHWCLEHDKPDLRVLLVAEAAEANPVVKLYPPVESPEELAKATADLTFEVVDEIVDEFEEEKIANETKAAEIADESEKAEEADETEEVEEMEAEKPLPSIPYVYVQQECREILAEGCPAHFIFSNELRKAALEAIADARREQCVPSMHKGLPVERLAAALITAACVGLSASSNGHMKAINTPGFARLFEDGPHDEELDTIKCIRDGESICLSITRGAMFDAFFGKAAEYYGVATLEMRHRIVENVQGLRCPETYPNYLLAVKLPCLDCGDLDSAHIALRSNSLSMPVVKCLNDECFAMCKVTGPLEGFAKRRMAQATKLSYERLL